MSECVKFFRMKEKQYILILVKGIKIIIFNLVKLYFICLEIEIYILLIKGDDKEIK